MRTDSAAVADRTRRAVALNPRLLSLRETVVLAGIIEREKDVRNDIARGVVPANVIRMDNSRLCFHWPYVLTFAAVYGNRFIDSTEMRRIALERVFFAASGCNDWKIHHTSHLSAWDVPTGTEWCRRIEACSRGWRRVDIDRYMDINLEKACEDVKPRVNLYANGLERVEESNSILGGAAVFRDTRLSVLHIGKMAERGIPVTEILEDYPKLTGEDVEFAKLYYRSRPPVGRPREGVREDVKHV